ncbi:uncharacterized protein GGS25DRAFT_476006 [Hypoxylon fragiforme]|uniref:uncharacterized protein n=1 Tax=Hypoxylon fragiforme TaxID=63214 RepID=UPI0020C66E6B|nr:uncharacterized protein GGS25DRAFT_476006 [Hypoxylon fragiforme]KAI2612586.1 hypothetical protein GGS25DRAFT_476006 [Hypoxylon fragiforme]
MYPPLLLLLLLLLACLLLLWEGNAIRQMLGEFFSFLPFPFFLSLYPSLHEKRIYK